MVTAMKIASWVSITIAMRGCDVGASHIPIKEKKRLPWERELARRSRD